ncbi:MAG: lipoyl synthase [Bacteroidales bacterium]|nr:lipoyl synthase [Bacteroidales bacterium]
MGHIRKPEWLKIDFRSENHYSNVGNTLKQHGLHTICSSGRCPNMSECWSRGTATFMILGDICTRACRFCNTKSGKPLPVVDNEPTSLAESIQKLALKHAVITSVDRDDLPDLGASHWRRCIEEVRRLNPNTTIEVLVPDFQGHDELIDLVAAAHPDVMAHNIETVERLSPEVRRVAKYRTSLHTLSRIHANGLPTKSGMMLGLGETEDEIFQTLDDLLEAGCEMVTIGQYLQPTSKHYEVKAYIHPDTFKYYEEVALKKGFKTVVSGPLVRSSYHADMFIQHNK